MHGAGPPAAAREQEKEALSVLEVKLTEAEAVLSR